MIATGAEGQTKISKMIEKIEAHSYLSTPALTEKLYEGWLLRLAKGGNKRSNSVNFPKDMSSHKSLDEKIVHCERYYQEQGLPCRFRLTPLAPKPLEDALLSRNYDIVDPSDVYVRDLRQAPPTPPISQVQIIPEMTEAHLASLCHLTEKNPAAARTFRKTYAQLKIGSYFAYIEQDGDIVACGFATVTDGIVGLFEFATAPDHRRKGYGADITDSLLLQAQKSGAALAYIQVVQSNKNGRDFWARLGFSVPLYPYQYLCKTP